MNTRIINMTKVNAWRDRLNTCNGWTIPALIELIFGAAGELENWDEPEGVAVLSSCTMMLGHKGIQLWLPSDIEVISAYVNNPGTITVLEDSENYPEHTFDLSSKVCYDNIVKEFITYLAGCSIEFYKEYLRVGRDNPTTTKYIKGE